MKARQTRRPRRRNPELAYALADNAMTGKSLAQKTGLHQITICRLLNLRQEPTPETAHRIAEALHTTPEALGWATGGSQCEAPSTSHRKDAAP